jgi:hypothetical protein
MESSTLAAEKDKDDVAVVCELACVVVDEDDDDDEEEDDEEEEEEEEEDKDKSPRMGVSNTDLNNMRLDSIKDREVKTKRSGEIRNGLLGALLFE